MPSNQRDAARALLEEASEHYSVIARKEQRALGALHRQILRAKDAGVTYPEIAKVVGLSEIRLYQIVKKERDREQLLGLHQG